MLLCLPLAVIGVLPALDAPTPEEEVEILRSVRLESLAHRRIQAEARAPQPVEFLQAEDLARGPAWTLPDRLRTIAGVDVYQLRHGQYEVGMRGYNGPLNSRLLLLVDGRHRRIEELGVVPWAGSFFLSDLDRVTVAKGPSSVTYGANAFGGVIDLRSRPIGDRVRLVATGSAGGASDGDLDATIAGPVWGPLEAKVSVGATTLGDLPTTDGGAPHQPSTRTRDSGERDLESDRSQIVLGLRLPAAWRAEAAWQRTDHRLWEIVNGASTGSGAVSTATHHAWLRVAGPWLDAEIERQWSDHAFHNQVPIYDPTIDFAYIQAGFSDRRDSARLAGHWEDARHRLSAGCEGSSWSSRSNLWTQTGRFDERGSWGRATARNVAAFAEDQVLVAPGLLATGGLRADRHDRVGASASPRAAINWAPDPEQFALLSYSSGYRQPTALELFQTDYFIQPNPGLRSERIHAVELAWKGAHADGWHWALGGFFNQSNHLIWRLPLPQAEQEANFQSWLATGGTDPTRGPGPVFQFTNLDNPVRVFGLEGSLALRIPGSAWSGWINGTWQRYRHAREVAFSSPGLTVPGNGPTFYRYDVRLPRNVNEPPPWKVGAGAAWWSADGWFADAAGRVVAGRFTYDLGHSLYATTPFVAAQRLDAYAALDLAVGWRLPGSSDRSLRLACLDVFDSSHHEHYEATRATLQAAGEDQLASTVGRQVRLTAAWSY
jgi:outer membrane receptor for ferrienterochelin and colicins